MADTDDTEYLKLSIEEQCRHKLWRARQNGYEESAKKFAQLDSKSPEFSKYLGLIKGFVTDSNAVAQEKGLDAALAFVENSAVAGKTAAEVCSAVIQKCLGAPKTKTKEKGQDLLLMYIEIEKQEVVIEELINGIANKNPKVIAACVQTLKVAVRDFGTKALQVKPIVKVIPGLLEDRDKTVRDETKMLVAELYRWLGAALKNMMSSVKPLQLQEIETEIQKADSEGKATVSRWLRSQKAQLSAASNGPGVPVTGASGSVMAEAIPEAADPWDFVDPVDILSKMDKEFGEKIESKKWQDRKETLDALLQLLTDNPKLDPQGHYGDLVSVLKKVIAKDANINVVAVAAKCLAAVASGLRKKFGQFALVCIGAIVEKFKEKKPIVVQGLREAIDAVYKSTTIEAIQEEVVAGLDNKNPSVKGETAQFLARAFAQCSQTSLNKKLLKIYSVALIKCLNEPDPGVRDAAAEALGVAMKVVGEKGILAFLADVDTLKMAKVKEFCDKAQLAGGISVGNRPAGAVASTKPPAPPLRKSDEDSTRRTEAVPTAVKKPPAASSSSSTVKGKPVQKKVAAGGKPAKTAAGAKADPTVDEAEISVEEALERATELFPSVTLTGIESSNWKERLESLQSVKDLLERQSPSELPCQAIIRFLAKKKEINFQCLNLKFEIESMLARSGALFSRRSFDVVYQELVDKIGDVKNGPACAETLFCCAEVLGLHYVSEQLLGYAMEQKNPKSQSETLSWIAKAVMEFGLQINVKLAIDSIKKALSDKNPDIRKAAISLVGVLFLFMGQPIRQLFDGEKPQVVALIEEEFKKYEGQKPPAPTRFKKTSGGGTAAEGSGGDEDGSTVSADVDDETPSVADLIPRRDISGDITQELLEQLSDKNWKSRNEALSRVESLISDAKFITPSLGGLPESLKLRLGDSNKILVANTLNICQMLALAVGPKIRDHVRVIGAGLLSVLTDSKAPVRQTAVNVLNAWVDQCGLKDFLEGELIVDALKVENPNIRVEVLNWLSMQLPKFKKLPDGDLKLCVPILYACVEDRSADVRKAAQEAISPFMLILGPEFMSRQCQSLKPSSADTIRPLLEKARANLPAKPVVPSAAKPSLPIRDSSSSLKPESAATGASCRSQNSSRSSSAVRGKSATRKSTEKGKKEEPADDSTTGSLIDTAAKQQRFNDERGLKVLKWHFTTPRPEYIDQLKEQLATVCKPTLHSQLFHPDFKQHLKALDSLVQSVETCPVATINSLDLLLKWCTLRFFDTNPTVLLRCLDYLQLLFQLCEDHSVKLHEVEASSFLPYLITKAGEQKDVVRYGVKTIWHQICRIYPASKVFSFILEGVKSKNSRQRTECLEELGLLIESYGLEVCQPNAQPVLRQIAQQIGDKDNGVRNAALNTIVQACMHAGEVQVMKYIGAINDKDLSLLQERIKRSAKNKPLVKKPSPEKPEINLGGTMVLHRGTPLKGGSSNNLAGSAMKAQQNGAAVSEATVPLINSRTVTKKPGKYQIDWDYVGPNPIQPEDYLPIQSSDWTEADQTIKECDEIIVNYYQNRQERLARNEKMSASSLKNFAESVDASTTLDTVVTQVASANINISIAALGQLDELLKDQSKNGLLAGRVDQLLQSLYFQYRMAYNTHMPNPETNSEEVVRLYRNLSMTLLSLLYCDNLIREATEAPLRDLFYNLITVLLDERLNSAPDGTQVIRSINVMVVKLVERTDHTACVIALVRLLKDCVASQACSMKFIELVMKCLWKISRMLPSIADQMNLSRMFLEIHQFFEQFPMRSWKDKPSDTPLRTLKTLMHTLVKLLGSEVLDHVGLIDRPQTSEVVAYLKKALSAGVGSSAEGNQQGSGVDGLMLLSGNTSGASSDSSVAQEKRRVASELLRDRIGEIFKKVGSKDKTKEGLVDLYELKKEHPDVDLSPFLRKASPFFQEYVDRGLKQIHVDRLKVEANKPLDLQLLAKNMQRDWDDLRRKYNIPELSPAELNRPVAPEYWPHMKALMDLRSGMGLDNAEILKYRPKDEQSDNASITSSDIELNVKNTPMPIKSVKLEVEPIAEDSQTESDANQKDLKELRDRLQRIKQNKNAY